MVKDNSISSEELLLIAKISDAINISVKKAVPKFSFFLDQREITVARAKATFEKAKFCFFGGYDNAERQIFAALPDWCDHENVNFPISPITVTYRNQDKLAHKDFLGTLMSFGIKREVVGDILVEEGKAVLFLHSDILKYVLAQFEKIGGVGVEVFEGIIGELPQAHSFKEITTTIASARLDCTVSALLNVSREKSASLIISSKVILSYAECNSLSENVRAGDTLSIRGYGKYKIDEITAKTKKGRIVLKAQKYI